MRLNTLTESEEKATQELLLKLVDNKMALFVGAGIDFNSGVPLAKGTHGIMTDILKKLPLTADEQKKILYSSNLPFEAFFFSIK